MSIPVPPAIPPPRRVWARRGQCELCEASDFVAGVKYEKVRMTLCPDCCRDLKIPVFFVMLPQGIAK